MGGWPPGWCGSMIQAGTLSMVAPDPSPRMRWLADLIPGLLLPVLLVINPVVVQQFTPINRSVVYYLLALDLICLVGLALHLAAKMARLRVLHYASVFWLVTIPIQLLLLEVAAFYYGIYLSSAESFVAEDGGGLYLADDRLGWVPRPGAVVRHRLPGNYDVTYHIDQQGLRVQRPSPAATTQVHVFGDSFTFGQGVEDDETYAALLQQALGPAYRVLNYGVDGYGPEQMDLRMEQYADRIGRGDLVLWAPISEDLKRSFLDRRFICALASGPTPRVESVAVLGIDGFEPVRVEQRCSWLDVFLGRSFLPFANLVNTALDWFIRPRLIANANRILARAAALTRARGARFALIFLVQPGECLSRSYAFDLAGLAPPYQSLFGACPDDPATIHRLHFPADGHWTPAGHRWAAQALLGLLRALDAKARIAAGTEHQPRSGAPASETGSALDAPVTSQAAGRRARSSRTQSQSVSTG